MDLISIVIPVYNVEKYLNRCLSSVLMQSYINLEIILVDDGSTDSSSRICDDFSNLDNRIKVIHKPNGGLSDARNAGIDIASGKYICFIDSDDWVSTYYIENLYNAIRKDNATLSISQFLDVFDDNFEYNSSLSCDNYKLYNNTEALEKLFYQDTIEMSAWGKLYNIDLFKNVRYPVGKLYEDVPVTYHIISNCDKIAVIKNVDYYYLQRKESIQYQKFNSRKMDAIIHMEEVLLDIKKNYPLLISAAECRFFSCISNIYIQAFNSKDNKYTKILWNKLKEYRKSVLKNLKGRKKARFAALISYLGKHVFFISYKITQKRGR